MLFNHISTEDYHIYRGLSYIQNHLYLMIVYFSNYVHSGMQFMPYHHHIEAEKLR